MGSDSLESLILLPAGSTYSDGRVTTKIELSAIRPTHPSVPHFLKDKILRSKALDDFINDGQVTGNIKAEDGKLIFRTRQSFPTFLGFMMEAYIVRLFNDLAETIGHAAKSWAANVYCLPSETLKYKAVGTGFSRTKFEYPALHSHTDPMDIKFVKKREEDAPDCLLLDHLLVADSSQHAGIQVKAITGKERELIITPLLDGKYFNVITCLEHKGGLPSFEVCMMELQDMRKAGQISELQYHKLKNSIRAPAHLGIDQVDVNYYYKIAWEMFLRMKEHGVEVSRLDYERKDIALIEVANFSESNGILVPDNLDEKFGSDNAG